MLNNGHIYFILGCIFFLNIFSTTNNRLNAQTFGSVEGTVLDRESGERLFGATIRVVDLENVGSVTGSDGNYKIKLPLGLHEIEIRYIGYKDTTIQLQIDSKKPLLLDILLAPDLYTMQTLVVDADRIAKEIEDLATLRDLQKKQLSKYTVDVHKIAVLSYLNKKNELEDIEPFAFSERKTELLFYQPDKYAEIIEARRASKNFFSEFDFFSTGGGPLDLNRNKVPVSVLSEDLTIVGPISTTAQDYYFYDESPADSTWPEGTILYKVTPKKENAPLFFGNIWINKEEGGILGIDVGLNEFVNTSNGLYSVSDVRYRQSYSKQGKYWLPSETKLSAKIGFIVSKRQIEYTDVWTWSDYSIEEGSAEPFKIELPLYGEIIKENADKRDSLYWKSENESSNHPQLNRLQEAGKNEDSSKWLNSGMKALSLGYRIPSLVNKSFFTQLDDYYRFNKVEGHFAGIGVKTPSNQAHQYMFAGGYAFGRERWQYDSFAEQFFGYSNVGLTAAIFNRVDQRNTDRFVWVNPLYMSDFRYGTYEAGLLGLNNMDYYSNKGYSLGIKKKWNASSFLHVQLAEEEHSAVQSTTAKNIFGRDLREMDRYLNERDGAQTLNTNLQLVRIHLHHDTRKYQPYMLIRDFTTRRPGWVGDISYERSIDGPDYQRYRSILNILAPTFFASQLEVSLFASASSAGTPYQLQYGMNGFLLDDYIMQQPFLALPLNEAIGHRSSVLYAVYRFGTAFTRAVPIEFIRKSGVRFTLFASAGFVDQTTTMAPLVPGLNYNLGEGIEQIEVGAQMTRIFGMFYFRLSRRILGDFGAEWGFQAIF